MATTHRATRASAIRPHNDSQWLSASQETENSINFFWILLKKKDKRLMYCWYGTLSSQYTFDEHMCRLVLNPIIKTSYLLCVIRLFDYIFNRRASPRRRKFDRVDSSRLNHQLDIVEILLSGKNGGESEKNTHCGPEYYIICVYI